MTLESKRPLIVVVTKKSCTVNRQIGVGDSKNVIVFDPTVTGHVIRRMRSGRVRIFNGNQWEPWMVISTSNLVEIIDVGVDACGILSRSVGQKTGSRNMADIQNIKCKNQRKTSPNRRNFAF